LLNIILEILAKDWDKVTWPAKEIELAFYPFNLFSYLINKKTKWMFRSFGFLHIQNSTNLAARSKFGVLEKKFLHFWRFTFWSEL
jgi:hypothetical protein